MAKKRPAYHRRETIWRQSLTTSMIVLICGLSLCSVMAFYVSPAAAHVREAGSGVPSASADLKDTAVPEPTSFVIPGLAEPVAGMVIGEYQTASQNADAQHLQNIAQAAKSINGMVIAPGTVFSFKAALSSPEMSSLPSEAQPDSAPSEVSEVSADASTVNDGSASQVATALYLAALAAGMNIEERHPHTAMVDYAPVGLDASVASAELDLKIANPYMQPVTIAATTTGQKVAVKLIGPALETGLLIEPSSKISEYHPADAGHAEAGEAGLTAEAKGYCVVQSFRLYYLNGLLAKTEQLATDTYGIPENPVAIPTGGGFDPTK